MKIFSFVRDFANLQTTIWSYPIGRRIAAYALVWMGAILFLSSLALCVWSLWVVITGDVISNIFDNPPAEEWDIR